MLRRRDVLISRKKRMVEGLDKWKGPQPCLGERRRERTTRCLSIQGQSLLSEPVAKGAGLWC